MLEGKFIKNIIFLSKFLLGKKVTKAARLKLKGVKEKALILELLQVYDNIHLP